MSENPDIVEETPEIEVRLLTKDDLESVVRIDAQAWGKPRRDYYRLRIERAMVDTSVRVSLAAVIDGRVVGFLLGSVFYGDFGVPEPVATIDAIGVDTKHARHGVGRALWKQLATNLKGMRIDRVQTQVEWSSFELLAFFHKLGFKPASRLCLDRNLEFDKDE